MGKDTNVMGTLLQTLMRKKRKKMNMRKKMLKRTWEEPEMRAKSARWKPKKRSKWTPSHA
eukprot:1200088-Karenia_brevis.AAC.1